jgi:two-component system, NtrC family, response regulator HydG
MENLNTTRLTPELAERVVRDSSHAAAIIRPDLVVVAANEKYTRLLAAPGREIIGRRCYTISHGYSRPCTEMGERCPILSSTKVGGPAEAIHLHFTRKGRELERVVIRPIHVANDGRLDGFLETLYPVSNGGSDHERLIGTAPPFRQMVRLVERAAPSEIPVLVLGESGTGKELIARQIHDLSPRRQRAFVPVDCSGLAETLFESELFGHERGAFTGATHPKRGLVEAAAGGTLFLDEVGDIPLPQQVKLLRLLETGLYRRVGSTEQKKSDLRLVCATHRDLRRMVHEGSFRRDLYYRINAFPIEAPPLRERIEDLGMLSEELLFRINSTEPPTLSSESLQILERHCFPGNVRELLNILQRGTLLTDDGVIRPEHLPGDLHRSDAAPNDPPFQTTSSNETIVSLEEMERQYLSWVSASFKGDRRELATLLGVSERTLYRKLSQLTVGEVESITDS